MKEFLLSLMTAAAVLIFFACGLDKSNPETAKPGGMVILHRGALTDFRGVGLHDNKNAMAILDGDKVYLWVPDSVAKLRYIFSHPGAISVAFGPGGEYAVTDGSKVTEYNNEGREPSIYYSMDASLISPQLVSYAPNQIKGIVITYANGAELGHGCNNCDNPLFTARIKEPDGVRKSVSQYSKYLTLLTQGGDLKRVQTGTDTPSVEVFAHDAVDVCWEGYYFDWVGYITNSQLAVWNPYTKETISVPFGSGQASAPTVVRFNPQGPNRFDPGFILVGFQNGVVERYKFIGVGRQKGELAYIDTLEKHNGPILAIADVYSDFQDGERRHILTFSKNEWKVYGEPALEKSLAVVK